MSKAVLMSMNPRQCELVASGEATACVRKSRPKIETPFKVYIYCTKGKFYPHEHLRNNFQYDDSTITVCEGQGKVIGEFVCDYITSFKAMGEVQALWNETQNTCISHDEIIKYANGKRLYYLHTSNLVIYDKPKALCKFTRLCEGQYKECRKCCYFDSEGSETTGFFESCRFGGEIPVTIPPKGFCYVEELN